MAARGRFLGFADWLDAGVEDEATRRVAAALLAGRPENNREPPSQPEG